MAHIRQSRPDSGLDFQVKFLKTFKGVPSSLGRGTVACRLCGERRSQEVRERHTLSRHGVISSERRERDNRLRALGLRRHTQPCHTLSPRHPRSGCAVRHDTMVACPWCHVVGRALPTETKVGSGTSQSKSGTSVNLSNSAAQVDFEITPNNREKSFVPKSRFCTPLVRSRAELSAGSRDPRDGSG